MIAALGDIPDNLVDFSERLVELVHPRLLLPLHLLVLVFHVLNFSNNTEVQIRLQRLGNSRPLVLVKSLGYVIGELLLADEYRLLGAAGLVVPKPHEDLLSLYNQLTLLLVNMGFILTHDFLIGLPNDSYKEIEEKNCHHDDVSKPN